MCAAVEVEVEVCAAVEVEVEVCAAVEVEVEVSVEKISMISKHNGSVATSLSIGKYRSKLHITIPNLCITCLAFFMEPAYVLYQNQFALSISSYQN